MGAYFYVLRKEEKGNKAGREDKSSKRINGR